MPKYTYKVRDEKGQTFTGSYTTDNIDRLRAALQNFGSHWGLVFLKAAHP